MRKKEENGSLCDCRFFVKSIGRGECMFEKPKYEIDDVLKFQTSQMAKEKIGKVIIVDRGYQMKEPSYYILVKENENTYGGLLLYKHIEESSCQLIRRKSIYG